MDLDLDSLDAPATLAASSDVVRRRRLVEVEDLEVLAHWADVHSADPTEGPDGAIARRLGNVLVQLGGDGTPGVQDFCLGEIALARGTGVTAATNALADVLDLRHRLPRTWKVCRAGMAEVFIARRVARLSRHLPAERVGVVDDAVAAIIARESGGRVLSVAEGKIVEADPALHEQRVEEEKRRRYVGLSRTDEYGLRIIIARVAAGDAAWVDATIARVAEIIAARHPEASIDELRSIAMGWLARPAELLQLLLEHTEPPEEGQEPQAELDLDLSEEDAPDGDPEPAAPNRAIAFPADLLDALRAADLSALRPKAVLYVHLHEAALAGVAAAARVEGLGPATLAQLTGLLGRTELKIQPVLDLSGRVRTTAYEHPESLKRRVFLATGGDYWPYATSTSRRVDYDHPIPYVPPGDGGPPGQTGTHNSAPLGRRHHRWKTHAGYQSRQSGDCRYAWLTPNGLGFLVDHTGTRRVTAEHARMIIEAPPGVDIYPV